MPKGSAGGKKGQTKAQVHSVYTKNADDAKKANQNQYKDLRAQEQRKWDIPSDFSKDLLDIPGLHQPSFERNPINQNYVECMQDPASAGTTGDVISLKQQMDFVAARERAWRFRHATVCRCLIVAHGRRYGHGEGRLYPAIKDQAANIIACGAVG